MSRLQDELGRLADQYRPDVIALSEVVQPSKAQLPPLVEYLQKLGYTYNHYAKMAELPNYWLSGVALCSRLPLSDKQVHIISKNAYAANHGYADREKEVISAAVNLPKTRGLKIIVAHPPAIIDSFAQHRIAMRNLDKLIRSEPFAQDTILVGDMNEWRFMPGTLKGQITDVMYCRSGSWLHPTWRHNIHRFTPLRLNLDYIYWNKQSDYCLKNFKVLPSTISDHRPILANFEYLPQAN